MADVTRVPGLAIQIRLIVQLRWRLFRNGLRSLSTRLGLIGSIIFALIYGAFGLGIGAGIGAGSYELAQSGNLHFFGPILWGVSAFWQLFPVLAVSSGAGFDSRSLLRFPLRFLAYYALQLAQGFSEPAALCGLFWHGCLWLGVTLARPSAAGPVAAAIILSMAANILFNRMAIAWAERLLAQRGTREIFLALSILGIVCLQFVRFAVRNAAGPLAQFIQRTSGFWKALPPGQAGSAISAELAGSTAEMLRAWGVLSAYCAFFAIILLLRLRAEYLGEYFSDTAAPQRSSPRTRASPVLMPAAPVRGAGPANWWSGPIGAVFMKETRYLARNSLIAINLLMPLIIAGVFAANRGAMAGGRHGMQGRFMYPSVVAYSVLILMQTFSTNSFGFEGGGIQLFFLAPVPFRSIVLGKNLFLGVLLATEALVTWALLALLGAPPRPVVVAETWSGLVFLGLTGMATGNWLSLRFPRKIEFGVRRRAASGTSAFVYLLTCVVSVLLLAGIAVLGHWLGSPWVVPLAYSVLCVGAGTLYSVMLNATTRQAEARRETLIEQLGR